MSYCILKSKLAAPRPKVTNFENYTHTHARTHTHTHTHTYSHTCCCCFAGLFCDDRCGLDQCLQRCLNFCSSTLHSSDRSLLVRKQPNPPSLLVLLSLSPRPSHSHNAFCLRLAHTQAHTDLVRLRSCSANPKLCVTGSLALICCATQQQS